MVGGTPYPFAHSKHNGIRTYGLRCHAGGWLFEPYTHQRQRQRRMWRKRARRENKRVIAEWMEA